MAHYYDKSFINGTGCSSTSGETFPVINPSTGETLARVPSLNSEDVDRAIRAAHTALRGWNELAARKRSDILLSIAHALTDKTEELAQLITAEQGKPLSEARGEVAYSASYFRWFSEEAVRIDGDIIPSDSPTKKIFVLKQPIGVVAAISPSRC